MDSNDILKAAEKISPHIHRTPLIHSNSFSLISGADVFIKAENLQKTGSFKVRGAFNKLSILKGRKVVAASMGNHAQGVAFASRDLGIHATIVMPETAPIIKQAATRSYGAELILHGESFREALNHALQMKDAEFIHPFDDEAIIAGQGTIGLEILQDLDNIDVVLVPVGGGGLICGIAEAVKARSPKTKVIGVQTEAAASGTASFRAGHIVEREPSHSLADGIAVGKIGVTTFDVIKRRVDDMITVDENSIAMAILLFLERTKLVVEGAGAVPLAVLLQHSEDFAGKRVVLVISGGNIDATLIDRIIHRGLLTSGRIGVFGVIIDDLPGRLHMLTGIVAAHKGNILTIDHDRISPGLSVGRTKVTFTIETRSRDHLSEILSSFRKHGVEVVDPYHPSGLSES